MFVLLLVLDIVTKQLVLAANVPEGSIIQDWGIVRIGFILNYNAAFGIGANNHLVSRIVYLITASIMSVAISFYLIIKRKETKLFVRASFVLIITGAAGNMIDRIFYGPEFAVVDWIDFYWFWPFNFNIADCCIVIGTFMLIAYTVILEIKDSLNKKKNEEKNNKILSTSEKERLAEQQKEENEK